MFFFVYCFISEDLFGKLWGWERLLPLYTSVEWPDYSKYLEEYYNQNVIKFIANAFADQNHSPLDPAARDVKIDTTACSSLAAAVAKSVSNLLLLY
jgi:hypothetical protein